MVRAVAGLSLTVLAVAACEIEKVAIPRTESRIAMHAVLSATAPHQHVLLERTRNGSVAMIAPPFELMEPVVTDDIVETGAVVTLTTPGGQTLVAREESQIRGDGRGQGIYRVPLPGSALERNAEYRLTVRTAGGQQLVATTSVPGGAAAPVHEPRVYDRSREAVTLSWPPAPGARSYFVRVETPFGPRSFFTDSTHLMLPGDLRNADVSSLPHVFIPGFPQAVTVSAVDSNFYDWFRTHNERISGRGLINRVQGGIGLFGSLVRLRFLELTVTAPQTEPASGTFLIVGTELEQLSAPFPAFELYVESRAARGDQGDALSGRAQRKLNLGQEGCGTCGVLGTERDGRVELVILQGWYASDTLEIFAGELRGDTLVGSYRGLGGRARFVRQRQESGPRSAP